MFRKRYLLAAASIFAATGAQAGALSVMPIKMEVVEPGTSASATLRNDGDRALNAQIRVFRWSQVNGQDKLEPTEDVVASPPIASVPPGGEFHVRVIRANQAPLHGEENYRLVLDELPDANRQRNGAVAVVVRYVVPVFFLAQDASQPQLTWRLSHQSGTNVLSAENSGDKEIRISDLLLGRSLIGKGLAGYVLGHSTKVWPLTKAAAGPGQGSDRQGAAECVPGLR